MTAKYGIPYFQNFVNSELDPRDVRSLCCRLSLNVKELKTKTGGLFGAGDSTGSIGVVTLNLARLGYLSKDEDDLFKRLDILMDIAKDSLEIKRDYITTNFNNGLMPYTALAISGFQNHFSTIGIVGGNEMCLNFMGKTLIEEEAIDLMKRVMLHMRERILSYQEETGNLYNIEATPAESTSYRLARIDIKKYPDIIQASTETPYYTNSTQLPVGYTNDIYEYLDLQEGLQCLYTGGSVVHIYIGEEITKEQAKYLVKNVCSKYRVPYISITPTFSICPEHGYIPGEHHTCPKCS
jgi:ribonucleoside-triphosphate reductase